MKENFFRTNNLFLAIFLLARQRILLKTEIIQNRVFFTYENKPSLDGDITDFQSGSALIGARDLFAAQTTLKDLIWNLRRGEGVTK